MKCDIKIMGSPKRIGNIEKMRQKLGLSVTDIFLDNRPNGGHAMYTARRTWGLKFEEGVTHRCVLQDDLDICEGFEKAINRIVEQNPDCIISIYNPMKPMNGKSPYIKIVGCDLWGQALIIPKDIIPKIFEWVDSINPDYPHDDVAIAEYARIHGVTVLATRDSLVQHLGHNTSLLGYNNKNKVSKVFLGDKSAETIEWESDEPMTVIKRRCFMKVE